MLKLLIPTVLFSSALYSSNINAMANNHNDFKMLKDIFNKQCISKLEKSVKIQTKKENLLEKLTSKESNVIISDSIDLYYQYNNNSIRFNPSKINIVSNLYEKDYLLVYRNKGINKILDLFTKERELKDFTSWLGFLDRLPNLSVDKSDKIVADVFSKVFDVNFSVKEDNDSMELKIVSVEDYFKNKKSLITNEYKIFNFKDYKNKKSVPFVFNEININNKTITTFSVKKLLISENVYKMDMLKIKKCINDDLNKFISDYNSSKNWNLVKARYKNNIDWKYF